MKTNLSAVARTPEVKCIHCGLPKGVHRHETHHCPLGARHRSLGFSQYSSETVFAPKPFRMSVEQLRTANRATLKAFLMSHAIVPKTDDLVKLIKQALSTRAEYLERPSSEKPLPEDSK